MLIVSSNITIVFFGARISYFAGVSLGYFIYIESSAPRRQGDMARLVSAVYPPAPNGDCLQFWYYMLGNNTGSLSVYLRPNDGSTDKLLFRRVGNQAVELWLYESQTIRSNVVYQVSHPIAIQFPSLSCSIYRYMYVTHVH